MILLRTDREGGGSRPEGGDSRVVALSSHFAVIAQHGITLLYIVRSISEALCSQLLVRPN